MTEPFRPPSLIVTALWHIESARDPAPTLEQLAKRCGVSPAHLIRAMRLATGQSPMAHLRARTLTKAARRLAATPDDILQVALDAGYNSHEAFTRAFTSAFGCQPSALRRGTPLATLPLTEPFIMSTQPAKALPAPRLDSRPGFEVTGMADRFTFGTIPTIPALWSVLNAREDELSPTEPCAFGISYDTTGGDGFRYIAGFATAHGADVPEGMTRLKVPEGRYAVWLHDGHVSEMHQTMQAIFDTGLAKAGLSARAAPELEVYDARFDPKTGSGPVELWIPVEA
ncbi:AraC family transcriptional regulator [Flavimaricola marinus]|uniref:Right origin-binding protein n=1 Tax=Flavimaricola marinus TaxID=1819565 RepID=A0A238LJE0_9RHOB|nr:GyrI-like domain-containing protein [Flavimaricola marinus]SMY09515.1 Right origin-binding protein [Flavimaricola marinus]